LVPPINLRDDGLEATVAVVRRAASELTPFTLSLGPATTFAPVTPTVHLAVGGVGESALRYLRSELVGSPPLDRPDPHPFVPHVTLIQELDPAERIPVAVELLSGWEAEATFTAVHVLQHGDDRVWRPVVTEKLSK
jgi:2'-5' RNA ligase